MSTISNKVWYAILAFAILFAMYCFNPFLLFFQNDDFIHIPMSRDGVWLQRNTFRPICDLSIAIDYWLWQKNAVGYHFTNLILHIANTCCLYWLTKLWARKYEWKWTRWMSATIAVLFFIYAFHSEAIFWILGRSATLGSLFFLLSFHFFIKGLVDEQSNTLAFIGSAFFAVVAWFTYESTWILLPVFIIVVGVDWIRKKPNSKKTSYFLGILVLLFLLYLLLRKQFIGEIAGQYDAGVFLQLDMQQLAINYAKLLGRLLIPPQGSAMTFVGLVLLVLSVLTVLIPIGYKKDKSIVVTVLLLLVSPLPYCSFGANTHTVEAERYLYLPSVFTVMLLVQVLVVFKWKHTTVFILVMLHLYYLQKASIAYQTAGNMVKASFEAIHSLSKKDRIFVYNLPQQVNGALVFRTGFEQAVLWADTAKNKKEIIVLSLSNDSQVWQKSYTVTATNWEIPIVVDSVYQPVNGQASEYFKNPFNGKTFNPLTDAVIQFTKDGVVISQ